VATLPTEQAASLLPSSDLLFTEGVHFSPSTGSSLFCRPTLAAPEVTADEIMFRGNGAGHTTESTNDAEHANV
jgi:hypothetical protein